jgi:hypothetical protein
MTIEQTQDRVDVRSGSVAGGGDLRPIEPRPMSDGYDVHELWYKLASRPWSCLVVVSPERTPDTLRLARSLAQLGTKHRRHPVEMIDGTQLDLDRADAIAQAVAPAADLGQPAEPQFVIALDSPIANPVAIGLLAAGDAVLLLLEKGVSRLPQARKIVDITGRERMIGVVLVE